MKYKETDTKVPSKITRAKLRVSVRTVGHAGFRRLSLQTEQTNLREDSAVAQLQAGMPVPVCLPWRNHSEEDLGRRGP